MADIFLSYSHSDRERVELIVAALEASGFSVWVDRHLAPGSRFSQKLSDELDQAKAVIVAWSESASASVWVADEATVARDTGRLVPVTLDASLPPLGFRQFHTTDFSIWRGGKDEAPFSMLEAALQELVHAEARPAPAPVVAAKKSLKKEMVFAAAATGLVVIALIAYFLFAKPGAESVSASSETEDTGIVADTASIAIIPFANVSSDPAHSAFVDGLSDELISTVASIKGLRVPGRSSSFYFKDKAATVSEIAQQLNVRYVLEGSVRRDGDNLRITSQLTDAETGFQVWSQTYDRELVDLFAVQSEIAKEVTGKLQGVIGAVSIPDAMKNVDPKAHEMFLVGLGRMHNRFAGNGWFEALEAFEKAVEIDPDYPLANAYYAVTLSVIEPDKAKAKALNAISIAVAAAPESPDVIYAKGFVEENFGDGTKEEREARALDYFNRALALEPSHSEALHARANLRDNVEDKLNDYRMLLEFDPLFFNARLNYAYVLASEGRLDEALAQYDRLAELYPEAGSCPFSIIRLYGNLEAIGKCAFSSGDHVFDEDMQTLSIGGMLSDFGANEEAHYLFSLEYDDGVFLPGQQQVFLYWIDNDYEGALHWLNDFLQRSELPNNFFVFYAVVAVAAGNGDEALKFLEGFNKDITHLPLEKYQDIAETGGIPGYLGIRTLVSALLLKGRTEEARAIAKALIPVTKKLHSGPGDAQYLHIDLAILYAQAGDKKEAIKEVRKARAAGWRFPRTFIFDFAPWPAIDGPNGMLASLRDEPEFQRIMAEIRAENEAALEKFENDYGILTRIRTLMAAENSSRE